MEILQTKAERRIPMFVRVSGAVGDAGIAISFPGSSYEPNELLHFVIIIIQNYIHTAPQKQTNKGPMTESFATCSPNFVNNEQVYYYLLWVHCIAYLGTHIAAESDICFPTKTQPTSTHPLNVATHI